MSDTLRVEIKFKNARLYDAIRDADVPIFGAKSEAGAAQMAVGRVKRFCELHGFALAPVYELLNLKKSPLVHGRRCYRDLCVRIAAVLEKDPMWLFPVHLYEHADVLRPHALYVEGDSIEQLTQRLKLRMQRAHQALLPAETRTTADQLDLTKRADQIDAALRLRLTPREETIVAKRFGLRGEDEHSLDDLAAEFGVTKERIRQIEAHALRKLRQPQISRPLRKFLNVDD